MARSIAMVGPWVQVVKTAGWKQRLEWIPIGTAPKQEWGDAQVGVAGAVSIGSF